MTLRTDTMLTLLIVLVLALDAFVALQVYQQRAIAADAAPSLTLPSVVTTEPGQDAVSGEDPTPAAAPAAGARARSEVQSAVLASQLAFASDGVMPADSFSLQTKVPGPRFVDGADRAGVGVIGIERTDSTILFVTAETDEQWICASVDGASQSTQYGRGTARDAVDDLASCRGSQDGWG